MPLYVNDNGTQRAIQSIYVNDNGTQRRIQTGYVNDNGTVRKFFDGDVISIGNLIVSDSGVHPVSVTYRLDNDGFVYRTFGGSLTQGSAWITPQINMANYECRATDVGADPPSSGTLDTWLSLGTDRSWSRATTGAGQERQTELLIEIRRAADGVVMDSATITLIAAS